METACRMIARSCVLISQKRVVIEQSIEDKNMKKIMSLMMMACMLSNTAFASPSNTQNIAKAFNEYRFKMTVAVDPNIPDFKERALAEFKQKMNDLQRSGVSPNEIMDYMRESILDPATRSDFDRLLGQMKTQDISSQEAGNLAMQFMAGKYQQGASYSGGGSGSMRAIGVILGVVIVGVVTYIAYQHIHGKWQPSTVTQTTTNTETVTESCSDTQTDTDTSTYVVCDYSVYGNDNCHD
jgi:hypothetical protein